MGSGRSGPPLDSGTLDRYKPLGAFGQPVYLAHVQLKAAVRQKLGSRFAHFFATPDRDPRSGEIRWLADVQGSAVRWNDLPPGQQMLHALTIEELRSGFARYADELRANRTSRQALAFVALLDEALRVPDDGHLFLVGDQPVASFWGFSQGDGTAVNALSAAPRAAAPLPVAEAPPVAAPVAAAAERGWWRRWWWLALLALLLLLLLLLPLLAWWFGLFGWFPAFDSGRRPDPGAVPPAAVEVKPDPLKPDPAVTPAVPLAISPAVPPVVVPEGTRRLDVVPGGSERIGGAVIDPTGVVPVVPAVPSTTPVTPDAPAPVTPPAVPGIKPEIKPDLAPKAGDKLLDKPDAAAIPDKPPAGLPPLPPPRPPGQATPPRPELALPTPSADGSANLAFLEGLWRSRQGLVDRKTGQPVEQFYRFDRSGRGEIVIRRADGSECRAPAQAKVQNNALSVEELANALCPDGASYDRSRTQCRRQADGRTVCNGTNSDGSTYSVGIEKGN